MHEVQREKKASPANTHAVKSAGRHRLLIWSLSAVLLLCLATAAVIFVQDKTSPPPSLAELVVMSHKELAEQDLAAINLACASGLPGAENLDVQQCLGTLDSWAESASMLLKDREHVYHALPKDKEYTINRWRCAALVQYLNQVVGLSYNESLKNRQSPDTYDTSYYRDSRDCFAHGLILEKKRGTCASMPVVFASVARRMGYHIKLVLTRNHLFAKWDSPTETFNIEVTDKRAEFKPDSFYMSFPAELNPGEAERQGYLQSLPPERELSAFLHLRAMCLWDHGRLEEARSAFIAAARLDPEHKRRGGPQSHFIDELERQIAVRNALATTTVK